MCRLEEVNKEKNIGVISTNDLKTGRQCREAARKAMKKERHQPSRTSPEESYEAGSRTEKAGVC